MSIATETQRLIQAKTDLKTSIEKRGANIPPDNTIDTFANILDTCPFAVDGTFVPEDGAKEFSIIGLPFTPTSLMLICPEEMGAGSNRASNTFIYVCAPKGLYGGMLYTDTVGSRLGSISPTSALIQWGESGVTFTIPPSMELYFKGAVYNYYITGGVE